MDQSHAASKESQWGYLNLHLPTKFKQSHWPKPHIFANARRCFATTHAAKHKEWIFTNRKIEQKCLRPYHLLDTQRPIQILQSAIRKFQRT